MGALRRAEARTCQLDLSGGAIAGCPPGLHGGSRGWQSGGGPRYMLRCLPFRGPRSWILGFGAVLGPVRPCFSLPCLCPRFLALGPGGALAVLMVGLPRSAKQLDPSLSPETAQRLPKAPGPWHEMAAGSQVRNHQGLQLGMWGSSRILTLLAQGKHGSNCCQRHPPSRGLAGETVAHLCLSQPPWRALTSQSSGCHVSGASLAIGSVSVVGGTNLLLHVRVRQTGLQPHCVCRN